MSDRPYVEWKKKRLWKRVNMDWAYGYQCVDLVKFYIKDLLWYIAGKAWNANEMRANKYKYFDKTREQIKWTKNLMMWDVIFRWTKKWYHVAIFDHKANWKLYVIEQNWSGLNSGSWLWANAIREQWYSSSYWTWVRRCKKIFENLQKERLFIDKKLQTLKWDTSTTLDYKNSIRVME